MWRAGAASAHPSAPRWRRCSACETQRVIGARAAARAEHARMVAAARLAPQRLFLTGKAIVPPARRSASG
jgi:hypothetical protein